MHIAEHSNLHDPYAYSLLEKIHDITDKVIVFDDEHGAVEKMSIQDVGHFSGRLSRFVEVLTERFNHEDELMGLV